MKKIIMFLLAAAAFTGCENNKTHTREINPVDFSNVTVTDSFWRPRLDTHSAVTLDVCLDQCENKTARVRNFETGAGLREGSFEGLVYDDSDLYKMLEGIAYSLTHNSNPQLEAKTDYIIDCIAATQMPDGYLMTYYILGDTEKRWTDMDRHEMYCGGHLIEAAIAYYNATGKRTLLDVAVKYADHMMDNFGPDKRHWVPGHQEIELALVKLYYATGEMRYLDFAEWLIGERGHGHGAWGKFKSDYYQDLKPAKELRTISGHAVRAMYMFTAMADIAAARGGSEYLVALDSLWSDVTERQMYVTGGIGSSRHNEGFTRPYDLPNREAYCETCASVGMVMWNNRMNLMKGRGVYADIMERSMYNGALAGISLSGDKFFYVNPLESYGDHHRQHWYNTACCPSQISRFLPSIGNYIYATSAKAIYVNLYIGNKATFDFKGQPVTLTMTTDYPWNGKVSIEVDCGKPFTGSIMLRIPGWCGTVDGKDAASVTRNGYLCYEKKWHPGDVITLEMDMPVRFSESDPRVAGNRGKVAVERGPLVYCIEEVDNPGYGEAVITGDMVFEESFEPGLLGGVVAITGTGGGRTIKLVPYYAWDNRESGGMKVWIDKN